jgi:hypothetical protein
LPRRHTSSAAGALAAVLIAAACAPATAQEVVGPALRGSIGVQPEEPQVQPQSRAKAKAEAKKKQRQKAGGIMDIEGSQSGAATIPGNLATDQSLLPQPPAPPPPLGGLGDEPTEPVAAVPGFGITEPSGAPLTKPPGTEELAGANQPLPPKGHELDPYVPIGMKLGSFLLFSEAEVGTILTDNVLGTKTNTHPDQAFEFAPNVRLESNWSRHFFSAEFDADRSWYKDFSVQDDETYYARLNGRLDVTRRTHGNLELGKSQTQEGRNSISLTDIAGTQTNVQEQHITAGADHTFNRLSIEAEGTAANYDYSDFGGPFDPTVQSGVPTVDVRDYREDDLRLRGTYEFNPRIATFVEGTLVRDKYKQPVDVNGLRRDSSGFTIQSGLKLSLANQLSGEIGVGWGEQQSVDDKVAPIQGMLLNADLIWLPSPLTMMEFIARSEVSTSTLVDSLGAIDRFYQLSLQHAFWNYLVVGGFVSYEIADYAGSDLVDQRVKEGASAEYYFNQYTSVYARYEHTDFFSTDSQSDFLENEVRIGMRIRH